MIHHDNIEAKITSFLKEWYLESRQRKPELLCVEKFEYRWSTHYIYHFSDESILLKVLQSSDKGDRLQNNDIRPLKSIGLEFNALSSIYGWLETNPINGITAIRPLACFPEINALALEYLPGEHFLSSMGKSGLLWSIRVQRQRTIQTAHKAGQLLSEIHRIQSGKFPIKQEFDSNEFREQLQKKIRILLRLDANKRIKEQIIHLQQSLDYCLNFSGLITVNYLHNDYYPENIVQLPAGEVYTIDTTLHQLGPGEHDIAKFIVGVETTKRRLLYGPIGIRGIVMDSIIQTFLHGYQLQGHYNHRVLSLYWELNAIQRWIEVLEVVESRTKSAFFSFILKTRITPFFLRYLSGFQGRFEKQF